MKETAYLLQAVLVSVWWIGLVSDDAFFSAFQYDHIPPTAFWAFFAPDVVLIAGLSAVRAYRKIIVIEYMILGAFGYAALYCCNATALTVSGFLPTGLMLLGLAYNAFLCFNSSLFGINLYAGLVLFVALSLLGLISAFFMVRDGDGTPIPLDQTNNLVLSGPYRYVRNPMAIAGIGQGISIAIMFQSIPLLTYSLLGALTWHLVVRPIEERDMSERFGKAYDEYRERVSCWIPTFRQGTN